MSGMNMATNIKSQKITEPRCLRVLLRFLHSVVCLLPKLLHTVRFSASFYSVRYPLVSLISSSSCSCLLPRLPVICVLLSILPSRTCFRRKYLRQMWPIDLAFLPFIVCKTFVPVLDSVYYFFISHTIGPAVLDTSPAPHSKPSQVFPICFPKCPDFKTVQSYAPSVCFA